MRSEHFQHPKHNQQKKLNQLPLNPKLHLINIRRPKHPTIPVHSLQVQKNRGRY